MTKYIKEELEKLILIDKLSYEAIGRLYRVTGTAIKKHAKKFQIHLYPKRKINPSEFEYKKKIKLIKKCNYCGKPINRNHKEFCSYKCLHLSRKESYIKRWLKGEEKGFYNGNDKDINVYLREYLFELAGYKCQKCGWNEINIYTNKIPLQIHHIDDDCTNNNKENLIVLCPNCHSLTENYGRLNKKSKRIRNKIL